MSNDQHNQTPQTLERATDGSELSSTPLEMDAWTSSDLEIALRGRQAVLVFPLGSVEPHGPHLPLATDRLLAEESSRRAVSALRSQGIFAWLAPSLPYAVTEYAQGFCGAISLSRPLYEQFLREISQQYLDAGFQLICWVNHHLEPEQLNAITHASRALNGSEKRKKVVAPAVVSKRWGRALGSEFRSGACHAGEYEGSMVLATHPHWVKHEIAAQLPDLDISLSQAIQEGKQGFLDAGMTQAYTGSPSTATPAEGERLYLEHTNMIVTEVMEALIVEGLEEG